jgi:hypothetical protein
MCHRTARDQRSRAFAIALAGTSSLLIATSAPAQPAEVRPAPAPARGATTADDELPADEANTPATAPPPADPGGDDELNGEALSAEELAEIQRALGQDAANTSTTAPPTRGAASASGGVQVDAQAALTAADMLPNMSVILDVALAYFDDDDNLQTGAHDPSKTGFNLQQLELSLNKAVDPYFRFDSNIVFAPFGVEIEEAYATTLSMPWGLQARAGQFLTRFGRINNTHPHSWDFLDQPFIMGKVFGGEGNRGLGAELSWLTPLPWYVEVVFSTTDAAGAATARSFYGAVDRGVDSPLDFQNTFAVKQFFDLHDDWSLMFGTSGANGPNPTGRDTRSDIYGLDLYLKYRPITRSSNTELALQAEWLYRRRQIPFGLRHDSGGYAFLRWRFAQRMGVGARYEYGSPSWDGSGMPAPDDLDPDQIEERHRGTTAFTFWPTEFSRVRVQGAGDFPDWRPDPIWSLMLGLEVVIGTHGAHNF